MFDFLKKLFSKKKPKKKVVKAKKKSNKTSSTKAKNAVCYSRTNSVRLKPSNDDTSNSTQSNEAEVKTNNTSKSGRQRSKYGFAKTKEDPHRMHPAFYRKKSSDEIDYVTFTHSPIVYDEKGNPIAVTIPLTSNISPKERGKKFLIYILNLTMVSDQR